ncbi:inositol monophosphatase [Halonotius sp. F2-221B]|uniref:inositol monophosphatase family protein n=1 Tax=Halonotius sp. F2-221B TaxID=2731620 RepID=UPI00398A91BA
MEHATDDLTAVAAEAVKASGEYLREAFRNGSVDGEFSSIDVKAAADRESEQRIQAVIDDHYPDHAFHGEESGRSGESDYRWIVDPLDGTNNFASGYPKFATAVAVLHKETPVATAIYEPLTEDLYLAERDGEATLNGESLSATSSLPLDHGTVALVVGLSVATDPDGLTQVRQLESALRGRCKRVVTTWAPCIDWGLLARGLIEGLVCLQPEIYEQHAGSLLAAESGIVADDTVAEDGRYVGSPDRSTTTTLRSIVDNAATGEPADQNT